MASKGVAVAVVIGTVVLAGGGLAAFVMASSRRPDVFRPVSLAPPPDPATVIAEAALKAGGKILSELGDEEIVQILTDKEDIGSYAAKVYVTGGLYAGYQAVKGGLRAVFGSSKVCRCNANKDVFPNDMAECARLGVTDCQACGRLFNLATHKWPWTA